jgi:D-glycero-alpha-D-manno-heptose 1-phosphate guanylyltransferase
MLAIVLAGGVGTRLRAVLPDGVPKPVAPVAGRPFLHWLLDYLAAGGVRQVYLAVGFGAGAVERAALAWRGSIAVEFSRETEPLGTGGAMREAMQLSSTSPVIVLNGDTLVELDFRALIRAHAAGARALSIACVEVSDTKRYGRVAVQSGLVSAFAEKGVGGAGLINGGVYVASRELLDALPTGAFSFESDFLQPGLQEIAPAAFVVRGAFIDIGIPEDLARAQTRVPEIVRGAIV